MQCVIKEQPHHISFNIIVAGTFLLQYIHVTGIKAKVRGNALFNTEEKPVLVESVVGNLFSKIQGQFITNYQLRQFFVFKNGYGCI